LQSVSPPRAEAYGVDFSSRGRRTDEFLEIVSRLWAGETFSYQGKHFSLQNASIVPTPLRGRVPLYLGGFTDKALERTARYGDGYFGNEEVCDLYLEKLRACGKDPASAGSASRDCLSWLQTIRKQPCTSWRPIFTM